MSSHPDNYLWYEICDDYYEKYNYLLNEIEHYKLIFEKHDIKSLLNIINYFYDSIVNGNNNYEVHKLSIDLSLLNKYPSYYSYKKFIETKENLFAICDRLKYILYTINNLRLRRRLEPNDVIKNHIISRKLSKYFISKIDNVESVGVEAYLSSSPDYFWIPLTNREEGIINVPRINTYSTRLLPIICHESSHPIIDRNTKTILSVKTYNESYDSISNYVKKLCKTFKVNSGNDKVKTMTSSIFSEIYADIISVFICQQAYIWPFFSSLLWPWNIINAKDWLVSGYWKTHPPNEFRFRICSETLQKISNTKHTDVIKRNWEGIRNLQNDCEKNLYTELYKIFSDELYKNFKIKNVIKEIQNKSSKLYVKPLKIYDDVGIDDLKDDEDPIIILNSIWNTRYNRYNGQGDKDDRKTTKIIKLLYSSLEKRVS